MAVVQSRAATGTSTTAATTFTSPVGASHGIFAALFVNNAAGLGSVSPPSGWSLVGREQVFGSTLWGMMIDRLPTDGSETGVSITLPSSIQWYLVIWEDDAVGTRLSAASGETDSSNITVNTTALTTAVGSRVFAAWFQNAFGSTWSSTDALVATSDGSNSRLYVTARTADATTESMQAISSQGGFAGWIAASYSVPSGGGTSVTGTVAATTPVPTLVASGTTVVTGAAAGTTAAPTLAAAGSPVVAGAVARTTSVPTTAASGSPVVVGTIAATTPTPTIAASGALGSVVTGSLARTTPLPALAAAGTPVAVGTIAATTAPPTLTSIGTTVVTGAVMATTPLPTVRASDRDLSELDQAPGLLLIAASRTGLDVAGDSTSLTIAGGTTGLRFGA